MMNTDTSYWDATIYGYATTATNAVDQTGVITITASSGIWEKGVFDVPRRPAGDTFAMRDWAALHAKRRAKSRAAKAARKKNR